MVDNEKISVLYLDDEEPNLSAFKATFRRTHLIRTTNSAEEALALIEEEEPHIIIADQRMPKVSGVEFFQKVCKSHPDPQRILLTAYTSSQTVIDAVNHGHIDKYLVKPWDREMMEKTLSSVYQSYKSKVELKRKNEELFRVNSELNRFVYSVSHDLRAPLLSLLGLVDLCRDEQNRQQVQEYFELMNSSIRKMDDYIQTTLQYYRNLKTNLILEHVNLFELINEIIEPLMNYNGNVNFKVNVAADSGIFTDRVRLKIALNNLITNAVKYGFKEKNHPYEIEISSVENEGSFRIVVADQGNGMPAEKLKKIFDIFFSEGSATSVESSGLGLYLVQQAVDKIHGTVSVRSKVNVGTEFEINLPDLTTQN
ncbi:MAG TPA: hybrid sensor histidine kinase/response regulator [Cryomorphaceae bacterium]|nr:hybrid sensor histidine kinase/response regulator [Cryomorphaceae bacterium]